MENIIFGIITAVLALGSLCLSYRSFREKGFLFNNAYIYASKEERLRMNKKPHYRQSAIAFLCFGIGFTICSVALLTKTYWLLWIAGIDAIVTIIYAIVSSILIEKNTH